MRQFQFLGSHPLGVGAEFIEGSNFIGVEQGMDQWSEPTWAEQHQVFAAVQSPLGQGGIASPAQRFEQQMCSFGRSGFAI